MGVDEAFDKMRAFLSGLTATASRSLSEADTRAKIVDPVFKEILGWPESGIRREEPSNEGFADYVFSLSERPYLLVEAKRASPMFDLPARPLDEVYLVGGSGLSGKNVQRAISQAAGYAPNLGCPFAVITDGIQYVVFEAIKERVLASRKAVAFTDLTNARQFRSFYELLSCAAVSGAALARGFLRLEDIERLYVPLAYVDDAEHDLPRNQLWSILNHLATRILDDRPENRLEIIENCYVATRESAGSIGELRELLSKGPSRLLRESGSVLVKPSSHGRTSLGNELERDVKDRKPGVYVLTGGVGSGKTTFLSRFEHVVEPAMVDEFCAWFQVDFLPAGKPVTDVSGVEAYILKVVRQQFDRYSAELKFDGAGLRHLFEEELRALSATLLFGVPADAPERLTITNAEVDRLYRSDAAFVHAAIRRLIGLGRRAVFVLDNSDQLGEEFQEAVFLTARALQEEFRAICIVSLREEKFYAAYYRGVFNAFPTHKFHIGSPDLQEVLRKRLLYGARLLKDEPEKFFPSYGQVDAGSTALKLEDCIDLLGVFTVSITQKNRNIVRMLESVAAGNIRFGLEMFRDFVGSGNTRVAKILEIHRRQGGGGNTYNVPFHEFAKSVMLANREFYREGSSPLANTYARSGATRASHFTSLRILSYLHSRQKAVSVHGTGFIGASQMRAAFAHAFEMGEDFDLSVAHLVQKNLVESEPPRSTEGASKVDGPAPFSPGTTVLAYKIAAAGAYYLNFLTRSFAYVDLVMYDTAIADECLARDLANVARQKDMNTRVTRVRRWLAYLADLEHRELALFRSSSPLVDPLMPSISDQIEHEVSTMPAYLFGGR